MKTRGEISLQKILDATSIEDAERMIKKHSWEFISPEEIFGNQDVCNHLGWLLYKLEPPAPTGNRQADMKKEAEWQAKYYKIGKGLYRAMVDINGKDSLIIMPFLRAWYTKFLVNKISCRNEQDANYVSDKEMAELSQMISGDIRGMIDKCYCDRIRKIWVNKPKE